MSTSNVSFTTRCEAKERSLLFKITADESSLYSYYLMDAAGCGEILLAGRQFPTKESAASAINQLKGSLNNDCRYEVYATARGTYRLDVLSAESNELLGCSGNHEDKEECVAHSEQLKESMKAAPIVCD